MDHSAQNCFISTGNNQLSVTCLSSFLVMIQRWMMSRISEISTLSSASGRTPCKNDYQRDKYQHPENCVRVCMHVFYLLPLSLSKLLFFRVCLPPTLSNLLWKHEKSIHKCTHWYHLLCQNVTDTGKQSTEAPESYIFTTTYWHPAKWQKPALCCT